MATQEEQLRYVEKLYALLEEGKLQLSVPIGGLEDLGDGSEYIQVAVRIDRPAPAHNHSHTVSPSHTHSIYVSNDVAGTTATPQYWTKITGITG